LVKDSHVCGVESRSVNNSGLSGSSHGIAAALELGMDMANLFKHFFREYIFIIFSTEVQISLLLKVVAIALHVLLAY